MLGFVENGPARVLRKICLSCELFHYFARNFPFLQGIFLAPFVKPTLVEMNPVALHREDLKQTFSILHHDLLCRERVIMNYQNL